MVWTPTPLMLLRKPRSGFPQNWASSEAVRGLRTFSTATGVFFPVPAVVAVVTLPLPAGVLGRVVLPGAAEPGVELSGSVELAGSVKPAVPSVLPSAGAPELALLPAGGGRRGLLAAASRQEQHRAQSSGNQPFFHRYPIPSCPYGSVS